MNIFSPDPVDRDVARVRGELAAMQSDADVARHDDRTTATENDRAGTLFVWPSSVLRFAHVLREMWRDQVEAQERLAILHRPWTHKTAHWHEQADGSVVLHGEDVPQNDRSIPVTRGGWCPSSARDQRVAAGHQGRPAQRARQ